MDQIHQFIVNHWQLFLALFVVLLLILFTEIQAQAKRAKAISPQAAIAKINNENAVIFDLRTSDNFNKGHILDAICVSADDLSQNRLDKYKSKPIIVVCERGLQSQAFAGKLREQQFLQTAVLAGGIEAWKSANLPLVKGK